MSIIENLPREQENLGKLLTEHLTAVMAAQMKLGRPLPK